MFVIENWTNKIRKIASEFLTKASPKARSNSSESSDSSEAEDDSVYVNSYSNYNIHLEMLQVKNILKFE